MAENDQSSRLTTQHKESHGVDGIFGKTAKEHDLKLGVISKIVLNKIKEKYSELEFRYRKNVKKSEINKTLNELDSELGQILYLKNSNIIPDGGIIEVKDDRGKWRVILISEAKYQGKDIENIKQGKLVGKKNNQDLMAAGNAIERSHKNISELANYMLNEPYFPYVIFLEGSNFLTQTIKVQRPDGRVVTLDYDSGILNRLDRLTSANYGMPFNKNLCINKTISVDDRQIMLQAASIYTKGDGSRWSAEEMYKILLEISETSLRMLARDIFKQLTNNDSEENGTDAN